MMWADGSGWVATGVGAPVAAVFLLWAALVLHCDRRRWRPLDPLLMALLLESVLQQAGACLSTAVTLFRPSEELWCSALVWWLAAVRTLQAGTLVTLAAGRLLRVRYSTLLYHLACLLVVSGCVGVAAVLARASPCQDLPDRRYVVFNAALHAALVAASLASAVACCCRPLAPDDGLGSRQRRRLLNSSSDLSSAVSDISMISTMRSRGKSVAHSASDCSARRVRRNLVEELLRISPVALGQNPPVTFLNGAPDPARLASNAYRTRLPCGHYDVPPPELQIPCAALLEDAQDASSYGASTLRHEPCYISTSTSASSTNSRSPCLAAADQPPTPDVSLGTVLSVLLLCYAVNHLPVLALTLAESFAPHLLPHALPLASLPLYAGLLEGVLLPIVIALADKAFTRRVAAIYTRRRPPADMTKPPQGLHGKFRPFNNGGCLVETGPRPMETVRFPITNGSLFTSLDGRIPIVHNYRRTKGVRTSGAVPSYCLGQRYCPPPGPPTHQDLRRDDCAQLRANIITAEVNCDRKIEPVLSPFSEALLTSPDTGQCYTQRLSTADLRRDHQPAFPQNIQQLRETLFMEGQVDSEDDDFEDGAEDLECEADEPIYATLSSRSACSATTAANDDFEFYQREIPPRPSNPHPLRRVTRSSSAERILCRQESEEEDEEGSQSDECRGREPRGRSTPLYRQQPAPRRPRLARPLSRRLGPPTPPPPRRPLAPVLSVDSLVAALHQADVSYLDTGDLCRHPHPHGRSGSVPDLKKVFYTGFL